MNKNRELIIPEIADNDPAAVEVLRAWISGGKQLVSLRVGIWPEPQVWGIFLADLAGHIVNAYVQEDAVNPQETLKKIRDMFNAELNSPTDVPQGSVRKQRNPHRRS